MVWLKTFFFFDKCLPFGSSISCAIFQAISDAIAYVVKYKTKKPNVNYLDDFLFAAALKKECDRQMTIFLAVCSEITFPVAMKKTFWSDTVMVFLGLLLNMVEQLVYIPIEKIQKALDQKELFLNKRNKKATVLQFQHLCGSLNFLCKCVVLGHAFFRRLYVSGVLKQHHHMKITQENRLDLMTWKFSLQNSAVYSRGFIQPNITDAKTLDLFSDASRNFELRFGTYCGTEWIYQRWDPIFCAEKQPSIEFLELFALTVGVISWLKFFRNMRISLLCDNQAVVNMVNNNTSSCPKCMILIRMIVLESLVQNSRVFVKFVRSKDNGKADALSRM